MQKISFIVADSGTISAHAEGKAYTISYSHPNYMAIKEAIGKDDIDTFKNLCDIAKSVEVFSKGKIIVKDGHIYYGEKSLDNLNVAKKILRHMHNGLPFQPLVNFLEKLMQNPSKRAVDETFDFLQNHGLPICEDGDFYAYKRVRQDWKDVHSGTVDNNIGQNPKMDRNEVNDDFGLHCSEGFHVGSMNYVGNFATDGRIIMVKVNPKDVVCVPKGEPNKCRVCEYVVVEEYKAELSDENVYMNDSAQPIQKIPASEDDFDYDEDEWDYDDDDYYEDEEYEDDEDY